MMKAIHEELTANVTLSAETEGFPPGTRIRRGCLLSLFLSNMVLEVGDRVVRQEKEKGSKSERKK